MAGGKGHVTTLWFEPGSQHAAHYTAVFQSFFSVASPSACQASGHSPTTLALRSLSVYFSESHACPQHWGLFELVSVAVSVEN